MSLARSKRFLIYLLTYPDYRRFTAAARNPERAYARLWEEIKPLIRRSELWGKSFRDNLEEYDITTLELYQPLIQKSFESAISLLNREPVLFWSQSAGTTGARKLFPMTRSFRKQFQRTIPPMVHSLIGRYDLFLKRPVLYFAATDPQESSTAGVEIGFISNYNYRTIPGFMRSQYAFPREVLRDSATFARYSPVYALATDLSAMFAVTPLSFKQLIQRIRDNADFILGCLRGDLPLDPTLPKPAVSAERLALVKSLLLSGDLRFRKLWPSLQFVCSWKTAVCASHLYEISSCLEGIDVVDAVYSATEGWINVPGVLPGASVLHPAAHIFEFIETGREISKANLIRPWDLKPGGLYEIFLTTAMGMIRYRLFDIVKCTGFYHRAPLIEFHQKSASILSLGLVSISEAELLESFAHSDLPLQSNWRVGPNKGGNGLVLYVDRIHPDLEGKTALADEHLRSRNINYEIYTSNRTMERLSFELLPPAHPLWTRDELHAQTKPVLLIQCYPGE